MSTCEHETKRLVGKKTLGDQQWYCPSCGDWGQVDTRPRCFHCRRVIPWIQTPLRVKGVDAVLCGNIVPYPERTCAKYWSELAGGQQGVRGSTYPGITREAGGRTAGSRTVLVRLEMSLI